MSTTWLITGASTGFGRLLAERVVAPEETYAPTAGATCDAR